MKAKAFANGPARIAQTVEEAVEAKEVIVVYVRDHASTSETLRTPMIEALLTGNSGATDNRLHLLDDGTIELGLTRPAAYRAAR